MFDFERRIHGYGWLGMSKLEISVKSEVAIDLYAKIFNCYRKIDFELFNRLFSFVTQKPVLRDRFLPQHVQCLFSFNRSNFRSFILSLGKSADFASQNETFVVKRRSNLVKH